jgi:hypothetical protein
MRKDGCSEWIKVGCLRRSDRVEGSWWGSLSYVFGGNIWAVNVSCYRPVPFGGLKHSKASSQW